MDQQHCVKDDLQKNKMVPKVIAFFLPQYHAIPENDKWWGKGFTEWTNVKRAKKIFDGQYQPQVPLNKNYYNLLDRKTVEWQTDLANKYGVYGFCYFHYNFCGKKLLEKPAENLLKWKDIPQRFCFAWANSTWARTWKNVRGERQVTFWIPEDEGEKRAEQGILMEQCYGDETDWKSHFEYLLPFFQDVRYIKKDGKPVFLIYQLNHILNAKEMFKLWNEMAVASGLPGIHLVSINEPVIDNPYVDAVAYYGIGVGLSQNCKGLLIKYGRVIVDKVMRIFHIAYRMPQIWDYEFVWKTLTEIKPYGGSVKYEYAGAFVNQDDTPRNGRWGTFLKNSSPQLFRKYMEIQLKRARDVYRSEFLFLDAWNEWGEGNHLEPDEKDGYAYLEALSEALKAMG